MSNPWCPSTKPALLEMGNNSQPQEMEQVRLKREDTEKEEEVAGSEITVAG